MLSSYRACLASLLVLGLLGCGDQKKSADDDGTTSTIGSGGSGGTGIIGGEGGAAGAVDCGDDEEFIPLLGEAPEACAQVCQTPGVVIESEEDRDEFAERGCEALIGSLRVAATDIDDLNGLEDLRIVDGSLAIASSGLIGVAGLDALEVVTRDVELISNEELDSLQGLSSLREIQGGLTIADNATLDTLGGLEALELAENVLVAANPRLNRADAFASLLGVVDFTLAANDSVTIVSAPGLEFLRGALSVTSNPSLDELVFDQLGRVARDVSIVGNSVLSVVDVSLLQTVGGSLNVSENPELETLVLNSIDSVGELNINGNPKLPQCQVDALDESLEACSQCEGNDEDASCD